MRIQKKTQQHQDNCQATGINTTGRQPGTSTSPTTGVLATDKLPGTTASGTTGTIAKVRRPVPGQQVTRNRCANAQMAARW